MEKLLHVRVSGKAEHVKLRYKGRKVILCEEEEAKYIYLHLHPRKRIILKLIN